MTLHNHDKYRCPAVMFWRIINGAISSTAPSDFSLRFADDQLGDCFLSVLLNIILFLLIMMFQKYVTESFALFMVYMVSSTTGSANKTNTGKWIFSLRFQKMKYSTATSLAVRSCYSMHYYGHIICIAR